MTELKADYVIATKRQRLTKPWNCPSCGATLGYVDACGNLTPNIEVGQVAKIRVIGKSLIFCECGGSRRWYEPSTKEMMVLVLRAAALVREGMEPEEAIRQVEREMEEE